MATGVNVKMGVSGVAQFKQAMKDSQAAVKNLDQQLKLNEEQLKLNGDAELYMQNKTELLQQQIKKQSEVVKQNQAALEAMRKNGVSETSAEFQRMQQQLYKSATDLTKMRSELENIGTAGEEAGDGVDSMNQQLQRIGDGVSFQNVISGIDSITSKLEAMAKKAFRAGEALVKATLGAGSWADDLKTRAKQYGISTEELQRMDKTAELIDTDTDTIINAQKRMRQGIGKESQETMGAFAALAEQGLLPKGYDPRIRDSVDVFWDVGEALMMMNDEYEQQVYAQQLFGRNWTELIPLFSTGRKEYEETMAGWSVVSDETIESLGKMDDQYQKLSGEFETFKTELLGAFSGPLTQGMEILTELFRQLNEYLQTEEGQQLLERLGEAVTGLFEDLSKIDPAEVVQGFADVFNKVIEGFQWLWDHKEDVVHALEVIVIGWGALKLTGGALKLLELVAGLKWLSGGPSIPLPGTGGGNGLSDAAVSGAGAKAVSGMKLAATGALSRGAAALTMFDPTGLAAFIPQALADNTVFGLSLQHGYSFGEAFEKSMQSLGYSAQQGIGNFTDYFTKSIPQGGDYFWRIFGFNDANDAAAQFVEMFRTTPGSHGSHGFDDSAYYRMARETDSNIVGQAMAGVNNITNSLMSTLPGLPGLIQQAVENANINVYLDGDLVGNSMMPRISGGMARAVVAMTK